MVFRCWSCAGAVWEMRLSSASDDWWQSGGAASVRVLGTRRSPAAGRELVFFLVIGSKGMECSLAALESFEVDSRRAISFESL